MIHDTVVHSEYKEPLVSGRYLTHDRLFSVLEKGYSDVGWVTEGRSVLGKKIPSLTFGNGTHRILMWSQMHGNESTTTKAVLDMFRFLRSKSTFSELLLRECTIKVIPMLNPDGADAYTRVNANEVDLNREAQLLGEPESRVLRLVFENFKPHFCFNLHDQRTIFNVGSTEKPATVSFLAPAHDAQRSISESRGKSMQLIVAMNKSLQKLIPGQIGRYDDGFNPNCVGDSFQMEKVPTILFEAGHAPGDYGREKTRAYIFTALLSVLEVIATSAIDTFERDDYFSIPENGKQYYDVLIHNPHRIAPKYKKQEVLAILFKEVLLEGSVVFLPVISRLEQGHSFFGHRTFDCESVTDLEELKCQAYWSTL